MIPSGDVVRAERNRYNDDPPGQGSFPLTVERVGEMKGNLFPRSFELARKETGMPRGQGGVRAAT